MEQSIDGCWLIADIDNITDDDIEDQAIKYTRMYLKDKVIEYDSVSADNISNMWEISIDEIRKAVSNKDLESYLTDDLIKSLEVYKNCKSNIDIFIKVFHDVAHKLRNAFAFTDLHMTVGFTPDNFTSKQRIDIKIVNGKVQTKNLRISLYGDPTDNATDFRCISNKKFCNNSTRVVTISSRNDAPFRKKFPAEKIAKLRSLANHEDDNSLCPPFSENSISLNAAIEYTLYYFMPNSCFK